jgi:hypothetical protein
MAGRPRRKQRERLEREAGLRPPPPVSPAPPRTRRLHTFVIPGAHGDPLEIFRDGLALARRAGMPWQQALDPARLTALSVESDKREREQWAVALDATRTAWMRAYERRSTGCPL